MKKQTKKLSLKKFKVAKLNNSGRIIGGSITTIHADPFSSNCTITQGKTMSTDPVLMPN